MTGLNSTILRLTININSLIWPSQSPKLDRPLMAPGPKVTQARSTTNTANFLLEAPVSHTDALKSIKPTHTWPEVSFNGADIGLVLFPRRNIRTATVS